MGMARRKTKEVEILEAINFFKALRAQGSIENAKVVEALDEDVKRLQEELIALLNRQYEESKKE